MYAVLSFLSSIILARSLGAESYGIYSWCLALIGFLVLPVSAGVPELIIRESAKLFKRGLIKNLLGLWFKVAQRTLLLSFIVTTLIVIFSWSSLYMHDYDSPKTNGMLYLSLGIPFIAASAIMGAMLRGIGRVVPGQIGESFLRPMLVFLSAILLSIMVDNPKSGDAIFFYLVAIVLASFVNFVIFKNRIPFGLLSRNSITSPVFSITKAVFPLALITGLQIVIGFTDIILIGIFLDDADVGIYKIAMQFSVLVSFGLQAINQVIQPRVSELYSVGNFNQLQNIVARSSVIIFFISLPVVVLLFFYSTQVIEFTYGKEYTLGSVSLTILALGQMMNACFGSVGSLLNMSGNESYTLRGLVVAGITNVLLGLILIPIWGIEGAAIATMTSMMLWNWILRNYVKKLMPIEPSIISGVKYILSTRGYLR